MIELFRFRARYYQDRERFRDTDIHASPSRASVEVRARVFVRCGKKDGRVPSLKSAALVPEWVNVCTDSTSANCAEVHDRDRCECEEGKSGKFNREIKRVALSRHVSGAFSITPL